MTKSYGFEVSGFWGPYLYRFGVCPINFVWEEKRKNNNKNNDKNNSLHHGNGEA